VQSLSDAGWVIREVRHSKFNGFFTDSRNAAFIRTEGGVIEAVFFESDADVRQIQVSEEQTRDAKYHRYLIRKAPLTDQRIEGGEPCYFTKYRNVFVLTNDRKLNDELKRLSL
jgi:hypothetical protein